MFCDRNIRQPRVFEPENKNDKRRTTAIRPRQLAFLPAGEMSPDISPCEPVTEGDKKKALILPYFFLKERVLFVLLI